MKMWFCMTLHGEFRETEVITWWRHVFVWVKRVAPSFWQESWCTNHWGESLSAPTTDLSIQKKQKATRQQLAAQQQSQRTDFKSVIQIHTLYWFGAGVLCFGPSSCTATGDLNTLETPTLKSCLSMTELCRLYAFGPGMPLEALAAYWRGWYDKAILMLLMLEKQLV